MQLPISSPGELGLVIRAVRKSSQVRQDDLAGTLKLSNRFTSEVEHGKPTAQVGKVMQLLHALGIMVTVDVPDEAAPLFHELQQRFHAQAGRHQRRGPRRKSPAPQGMLTHQPTEMASNVGQPQVTQLVDPATPALRRWPTRDCFVREPRTPGEGPACCEWRLGR